MLFSFENVHRQYLACRKNKRNSKSALTFECRQEENLFALQQALESRTYRPGRSVCFFSEKPKLREIFAADFRDRIVHHILVSRLETLWEPLFIHDSYACRRGKGTHRAVERLGQFLRQATANGTRPAWFLQLDIKNYFMTIDRDILYRLVAAKLGSGDDDLHWLTRLLIFHDCTQNPEFKCAARLLDKIPPHKTLFHAPPGKGLPIGNHTSQFFANVYLNRLDQFVKHRLKCHFYLRYCDDFVLVSTDRAELCVWREGIEAFLLNTLRLELNQKRERLLPATNGVDFLGYIVRTDYALVRRRVVGNLRSKLRDYATRLVSHGPNWTRYDFDEALLDHLQATLASYLGHFKFASTYRLCVALWERYPFLTQYFDFDAQTRKLSCKYKTPKVFRKVRQQFAYFAHRFTGDVLFFQVGRFFEFYESHNAEVAQVLGLAPMDKNRRGARYGFPKERFTVYLWLCLNEKRSVVVIEERECNLTRIKVRTPTCRYAPKDLAQPFKSFPDGQPQR